MCSAHVTNADWVFILTSTVLNNASASQPKFFFSSLSGISSPASTKQHDISANRHVCVRGPRRFRLVSDRNTPRSVHNLASLVQSVCTTACLGKYDYYSTFFLHVLCGSLPVAAAFSLLFQDKLLYVRILACFAYLLIRYV